MDETLQTGAHLSTPRLGYHHHGLYAGNGRVLHYGSLHRGLRRGPVEEVTLAQFTRGRGLAVHRHAAARFAGAAAIDRARSRLGEDRYRLWTNNCEHFVSWALNGEPRSAQIEAWRRRFEAPRRACLGLFGRLLAGLASFNRNAAT